MIFPSWFATWLGPRAASLGVIAAEDEAIEPRTYVAIVQQALAKGRRLLLDLCLAEVKIKAGSIP